MNADEYKRQRGRIERLVGELSPGATVQFYENKAPDWVNFSIHRGITILGVSDDWPIANVRDWSQLQLTKYIHQICNGRLSAPEADMDTNNTPPKPKCDLCDRPATNEAYDMEEVPIGGPVSNKIPTGKMHRGCDEHPASQRARRK